MVVQNYPKIPPSGDETWVINSYYIMENINHQSKVF